MTTEDVRSTLSNTGCAIFLCCCQIPTKAWPSISPCKTDRTSDQRRDSEWTGLQHKPSVQSAGLAFVRWFTHFGGWKPCSWPTANSIQFLTFIYVSECVHLCFSLPYPQHFSQWILFYLIDASFTQFIHPPAPSGSFMCSLVPGLTFLAVKWLLKYDE